MFQHLITSDISNSTPTATPGMLVLTLVIVTLFIIISYFWLDFFYVLFYKVMGLNEDGLFDTFTIALAFTLIVIFIIFIADECVDWDGWDGCDDSTGLNATSDALDATSELHKHLDELITLLKSR